MIIMKCPHRKSMLGKNNPMWKGDNVSYRSLHEWIENHKSKPKLCEECHKNPPFDLANISGKYLRDINDYRWLCRSCHMKSDGRLINLLKAKNKYYEGYKSLDPYYENKKIWAKNNREKCIESQRKFKMKHQNIIMGD